MTEVASRLDEELDRSRIPDHVAIIMDGNRRWAQQRNLPIPVGHAEGVNALYNTVLAALDLNIRTLTVFGFSTENWMRSEAEVEALVKLVGDSSVRFREQLIKKGVRLNTIGNLDQFPALVREAIEETCKATDDCDQLDLVLAISYGGRDDIVRAARQFAEEVAAGAHKPEELTEELLNSYLDTAKWSDPAMVIRTSGEQRLSNFLIWPASYSEIMVVDTLWPDFGADELATAVSVYQQRERRLGH